MKTNGLLSILAFSEKRRDILLMLQKESKTLYELKVILGVTSPEIIPHIKKLEKSNLIYYKNKQYFLTEIGEMIIKSFDIFIKTLEIYQNNIEFWKEHKISEIPEELRMRLYELGNYNIHVGTQTEIFKPHEEYVKNLVKSKCMKGVSPVLHPDYPRYLVPMVEKGVPVSIILTREVFEKIKKSHKVELDKILSYENSQIMICNEKIEIAFTVTDFFMSMRLFLNNNTYDFYKNIISCEKSSLKWGRDLFNYYEKRSKKVELQDF